MCSCVGGFSGANCESECSVKRLIGMRYICNISCRFWENFTSPTLFMLQAGDQS